MNVFDIDTGLSQNRLIETVLHAISVGLSHGVYTDIERDALIAFSEETSKLHNGDRK